VCVRFWMFLCMFMICCMCACMSDIVTDLLLQLLNFFALLFTNTSCSLLHKSCTAGWNAHFSCSCPSSLFILYMLPQATIAPRQP
jgi:hypothetical protein